VRDDARQSQVMLGFAAQRRESPDRVGQRQRLRRALRGDEEFGVAHEEGEILRGQCLGIDGQIERALKAPTRHVRICLGHHTRYSRWQAVRV